MSIVPPWSFYSCWPVRTQALMVCVYCISLLNDNATSYHILLLLCTGLTCHCHSDNDCAEGDHDECTGALACIIRELPNGEVEQYCSWNFFDSRLCPAWITDKHYCCTTPLCNDITVLRPTTLMPQTTTPFTQIPSTTMSQVDPSVSTVTPVIISTLLAIETTHGQSPSSTYSPPRGIIVNHWEFWYLLGVIVYTNHYFSISHVSTWRFNFISHSINFSLNRGSKTAWVHYSCDCSAGDRDTATHLLCGCHDHFDHPVQPAPLIIWGHDSSTPPSV